MKNLNRREVCAGLSAVAVAGMTAGVRMSEAEVTGVNALTQSRVFRFAEAPASTMPNGAERREMAKGKLATGEPISLHETISPVGAKGNPAHVVQHSELITIVSGTLEFEHDGKFEKASAGDVLYVAVGTNQTVRNVGDVPAKYVVVSVGGDTK